MERLSKQGGLSRDDCLFLMIAASSCIGLMESITGAGVSSGTRVRWRVASLLGRGSLVLKALAGPGLRRCKPVVGLCAVGRPRCGHDRRVRLTGSFCAPGQEFWPDDWAAYTNRDSKATAWLAAECDGGSCQDLHALPWPDEKRETPALDGVPVRSIGSLTLAADNC